MKDYVGKFQGCKASLALLILSLAIAPLSTCHAASEPAAILGSVASPVEAAFGFLYRQMDQFNRSVVIVGEPGYQAFWPTGKMGDMEALSIETGSCAQPRPGKNSCLRLNYSPTAKGWAGVYFQYPENNWGSAPGRNLTGAGQLSFWARAQPPMVVRFMAGGINKNHNEEVGRYSDSFGPLSLDRVLLTEQWEHFIIDLRNQDLSSVIGGFAVSIEGSEGGRPGAIFLDDAGFDLSLLHQPRFLQSYYPQGCPLVASDEPTSIGAPVNTSHIYDQSLGLLALLARGTAEDLRRAELLGRALVQAQEHDRRFHDGRLRNAYASGPLLDPNTRQARLPGQWDERKKKFIEDEYAAGSDTGNAAWAALALVQAHKLLPRPPGNSFLAAAKKIAHWIVDNHKVEDSRGGFRGGFEGFEQTTEHAKGQSPCAWRSTEHNIDLVALFGHLASAAGRDTAEGRMWSGQQAHARRFVESMREDTPDGAYLWTGTTPGGAGINKSVIPLDAQTWSLLGMREPERYRKVVDWALRHCGAREIASAFDFNCNDGDGAWWEGTAQMAIALKSMGREEEAMPIIGELNNAQLREGRAAGALPAASRCGLTTGFKHFWHSTQKELPWLYPSSPHVGATAWYLFALMGKNPYYLAPD